MYANLTVKAEKVFGGELNYSAWAVDVENDGTIVIHLDAQNGTGNYAEPNGEKRLAPGTPVRILADF